MNIKRSDLPLIIASSPTKPADITIALIWTQFAGAVLPVNASTVQREEMKKAFYAGFFECFSVHHDLVANIPDDEGIKVLERLFAEAKEFYKSIGR